MSEPGCKMEVKGISAWFGTKQVLFDVNLPIRLNHVTAIIGPSGCGKTTLIRTLNRMHELSLDARVSGQVFLDGQDIYADGVDPASIRRRVSMVFQRPNPFPNMSISDNVVAGLKLTGTHDSNLLRESVERCLHQAYLWDEVKDSLHKSGASLSGGQQQRLCIARALAVNPEAILMDEPCSALDPIATSRIEELIKVLSERYTIVIVTHNMQQAARVSDFTVFMYLGKLIEYGETKQLFETPVSEVTENYITGKFG
jgi:phosphate transport system ATP-binding protein